MLIGERLESKKEVQKGKGRMEDSLHPHKAYLESRRSEKSCLDVSSKELQEQLQSGRVDKALTLVFTTSAVPTNPETIFFESVLASYSKVEPAIVDCRKIIVCDAEAVREQAITNHFRTGRVNEEASKHYREYKRRLSVLCEEAKGNREHPFFNAETLMLPQRHGFGLAVRFALQQVTTPFVMVIQHDRTVIKPFGLVPLLRKLTSFSMRHVNYVCLGTRATWNQPQRTMNEFGLDVRDYAMPLDDTELTLVPLAFWYDTTHICRTSFYRNFAMERHLLTVRNPQSWKWKTGEFIEDKLGQILRWQLKENGYPAWLRFGTYLITQKNDNSLAYKAIAGKSKHPQAYYDARFGAEESRGGTDSADAQQGEEEGEDEGEESGEEDGMVESVRLKERHVLVRHANQRKMKTLVGILTKQKGTSQALLDSLKEKDDAQKERMALQDAQHMPNTPRSTTAARKTTTVTTNNSTN